MDTNFGIRYGANKGYPVTKIVRAKPASKPGKASKRTKFIRSLIRDVVGLAPYERRVIEYLKLGKDRRALRFAKKRLGTHRRAKNKREELEGVIQAQRRGNTE